MLLNQIAEGVFSAIAASFNPSIRMPHGREPLKDKDIETLKLWVDQGAQNN